MDDPKEIAQVLAERTRSQVVQVVGKKITYFDNIIHYFSPIQTVVLPQGKTIGFFVTLRPISSV